MSSFFTYRKFANRYNKVDICRIYYHEVIFMAYSDRELIARLVQCEAGGEGDNRYESNCDRYNE